MHFTAGLALLILLTKEHQPWSTQELLDNGKPAGPNMFLSHKNSPSCKREKEGTTEGHEVREQGLARKQGCFETPEQFNEQGFLTATDYWGLHNLA